MTESSRTSRSAVGTSEDYVIDEIKHTEKTAELYFVRGRYDHLFSDRFFMLGGVDWLSNKFAGIDSRLLFVIGAGNKWIYRDQIKFKTDYGFTYTFQEDVHENPFLSSTFPGIRLAYDFWWKLTASTDFTSTEYSVPEVRSFTVIECSLRSSLLRSVQGKQSDPVSHSCTCPLAGSSVVQRITALVSLCASIEISDITGPVISIPESDFPEKKPRFERTRTTIKAITNIPDAMAMMIRGRFLSVGGVGAAGAAAGGSTRGAAISCRGTFQSQCSFWWHLGQTS